MTTSALRKNGRPPYSKARELSCPLGMALEPEQEELLVTLVEAWRSIPRTERHEFVLVRTSGPDIIIGPAGQMQGTYYVDVLTLVEAGFLNTIPSAKDLHFIITERGFKFDEELKQPSRPVAAPPGPPPWERPAEKMPSSEGHRGIVGWIERHPVVVGASFSAATLAAIVIIAIATN